jgi:hypothetical protein
MFAKLGDDDEGVDRSCTPAKHIEVFGTFDSCRSSFSGRQTKSRLSIGVQI